MRSPHRNLTFALALFAAGALVPAHADGPDCPRAAAAAAAPKPAPKATTATAESEKKDGLRRWKLEAL